MKPFIIVNAHTNLGFCFSSGTDKAPTAINSNGELTEHLARISGKAEVLSEIWSDVHRSDRNPKTNILNSDSISRFNYSLGGQVSGAMERGGFPIVLGGDCSLVIGVAAGMRDYFGNCGLVYIDGHEDYYDPQSSPRGEAATMALQAVTSSLYKYLYPPVLNCQMLVSPRNTVLLGCRNYGKTTQNGPEDAERSGIKTLPYSYMARHFDKSLSESLKHLSGMERFWIHVGLDVLDPRIFPATDCPIDSGGLTFSGLSNILRRLIKSGRAAGIDITSFNPEKDTIGNLGSKVAKVIVNGFLERPIYI